jgi:hypothetical protein
MIYRSIISISALKETVTGRYIYHFFIIQSTNLKTNKSTNLKTNKSTNLKTNKSTNLKTNKSTNQRFLKIGLKLLKIFNLSKLDHVVNLLFYRGMYILIILLKGSAIYLIGFSLIKYMYYSYGLTRSRLWISKYINIYISIFRQGGKRGLLCQSI